MFYTGVSVEGDAVVQRAGAATSEDLIRWRKHPKNPLIEADPRYYEQRDEGAVGYERMWRDPWVFKHRQTGDYHALITARTIEGPSDGRGVIGHARSSDLVRWETLPPLTEPGHFYALEVPQLVELGDDTTCCSLRGQGHTRPRAERKRVSSRWAARTTSSPTPLWARSDSPLTIS
jgi:beta-fructofuranosidase